MIRGTTFRSLGTKLTRLAFRLRHGILLSNRRYQILVDQVSATGGELRSADDDGLRSMAREAIRQFNQDPKKPQLVRTLAIAREAARRTLGLRPYDVQLLTALALNDKTCVEMHTGEGKTLAAALTVCLRAARGRGVHVLTFNDYLAKRDAAWMRPLYSFFGLSTGYVHQGMSPDERRAAYDCDVTYVTAKEAGFDYLRDQNSEQTAERVQRGFHFAIVDEADSILIDEARIPLVLAADDEADRTDLHPIAEIVRGLRPGRDYQILSHGRNCSLTEHGIARLEQQLDCGELHSEQNVNLLSRFNVALHAEHLLHRDVDYIVRDGAIELIDEFTGRVAENRRWPGGIQAALEAKEGLAIEPQGRILNSITMQYFLELYEGLAGMSGTAQESTGELEEFYDLKVVVVPPNRPCCRIDHTDYVFHTKREKYRALIQEITREHHRERPVLVGTASVDESEHLAVLLRQAGIACRVLNAANDDEEAEIVAEAGAPGAVTISTNMAGRGTDIRLGGSDERLRDTVVNLGGLYVIGTNRHESRRIDNQLRGRSGRQGDPGESRFFVSLEDDLLHRFGLRGEDTAAPESGRITDSETVRRILHLQRVIEGESFSIRRMLRKYAFLLERQRREICAVRDGLIDRSAKPNYLIDAEPEAYHRLVSRWGEAHIAEAESLVALRHIERCWSDHLEHAAEIRDGIHLVSMGGFNAFDEFNREMNREFRRLNQTIAAEVVKTMTTVEITADGIDLDAAGLKAPSSTWTYMITDNPKGGVLDQLTKGIVRMVKGWFRSG